MRSEGLPSSFFTYTRVCCLEAIAINIGMANFVIATNSLRTSDRLCSTSDRVISRDQRVKRNQTAGIFVRDMCVKGRHMTHGLL